jgi:probable phosphoglycerate mutase
LRARVRIIENTVIMASSPMIYLMRHGELDMGPDPLFVGQVDLEMSQKGIEQIRSWRRELGHVNFQKIYCNDLKRSLRTAQIMKGPDSNASIEILEDLREINLGDWDGGPIARAFEEAGPMWRNDDEKIVKYRAPNGESFQDLRDRVIPVFNRILEGWTGRILIAGHAGVNRVILCHLLDAPIGGLFRIGQDYGCMNFIDRERHRIRVRAMNIRPVAQV